MGDITLFGISMVLVIPIIVQGLKLLGLPDAWAPWATLLLAIAAAVAAQLLVLYPDSANFIQPIIAAIVLFLSATGLYHASKNSISTVKEMTQDKAP